MIFSRFGVVLLRCPSRCSSRIPSARPPPPLRPAASPPVPDPASCLLAERRARRETRPTIAKSAEEEGKKRQTQRSSLPSPLLLVVSSLPPCRPSLPPRFPSRTPSRIPEAPPWRSLCLSLPLALPLPLTSLSPPLLTCNKQEPVLKMQVSRTSVSHWVHLDAFPNEVVGFYVRVSFDKGSFVVARINGAILSFSPPSLSSSVSGRTREEAQRRLAPSSLSQRRCWCCCAFGRTSFLLVLSFSVSSS